jgi:hypothetical protein
MAHTPAMTAAKPRIVLLGAHRWRRQTVLQFVQEAGFEPVIFLYDTEPIPDLFRRLRPDQIIRQPLIAPRSAREIAESLSRPGEPWYVLALDDYVCEFSADLSAFAKKTTMPSSAARHTLHKHELRKMWNRLCKTNPALFPVPFRYRKYTDTHFHTIALEDSDPDFCESVPIIVKPDALDASIAIQKANSWDFVETAIDAIRQEVEPLAPAVTALGIKVAPGITAEHQIPRSSKLHPGAEFSAEFLTAKSLQGSSNGHVLMGITQKYINPGNFVEIGHCFPSETFPRDLFEVVRVATAQLLDQLDVRLCISHWEYIVTDDGRLALVEAQLRPGGDCIMNLITEATGRNPYRALFEIFRTDVFDPPEFPQQRLAAVFFPVPTREIRGKFSIVCEAEAEAQCGTRLFIDDEVYEASKWRSEVQWHSRFVGLISTGADFNECKVKSELVLRKVTVVCRNNGHDPEEIRLVLAP